LFYHTLKVLLTYLTRSTTKDCGQVAHVMVLGRAGHHININKLVDFNYTRTTFDDSILDFKHSRTAFVDFYFDFDHEYRHSQTVPLIRSSLSSKLFQDTWSSIIKIFYSMKGMNSSDTQADDTLNPIVVVLQACKLKVREDGRLHASLRFVCNVTGNQ
jgi:hypothetical protein